MSDSFVTPWASPPGSYAMEFPKLEYWSGLPFPSPGSLPNPGIEHVPPALAGEFFPLSHLGSPSILYTVLQFLFSLVMQ